MSKMRKLCCFRDNFRTRPHIQIRLRAIKRCRLTVFVVPPPQYSEFSWANIDIASTENPTDKLWVGSVELLFCCSFRTMPHPDWRIPEPPAVDCELAQISFFYQFDLPAAMGPIQKLAGAQMYYEPSTPWVAVVPVRHVVGRAPLMRSFVGGGGYRNNTTLLCSSSSISFWAGQGRLAGRLSLGKQTVRIQPICLELWTCSGR